jgi:type II secretion system protein G
MRRLFSRISLHPNIILLIEKVSENECAKIIKMPRKNKNTGFTIVELLIVIVVIGILAALVMNAFSGVQKKARVTEAVTDIAAINKAILAYHAINGNYPNNNMTWAGSDKAINFIPELVPEYIEKVPQSKMPPDGEYMYRSNGSEYKIFAHTDGLCTEVKKQRPELIDPSRDCWAYGYWSEGGSNF